MGGTNCCFTFSQYLFGMAFTEKNAGKPQIPLVTFIIFPTALPVVRPTQRVCDNSEEFLDPNIRRFFSAFRTFGGLDRQVEPSKCGFH